MLNSACGFSSRTRIRSGVNCKTISSRNADALARTALKFTIRSHWLLSRRLGSWNYVAMFQQVTWGRDPQLPYCVIRRMCAVAHSTRERMSISETGVRLTGHFSAISSSFERCSLESRPANLATTFRARFSPNTPISRNARSLPQSLNASASLLQTWNPPGTSAG